jgi:hypothetical protein
MLGDDPNQVFTVEIPNNKNVSDLKALIKEKKASHLNYIDASDLDLWSTSVAIDVKFKQKISKLKLADEESLPPLNLLSEVFQDSSPLLKRYVHTILSLKPHPFLINVVQRAVMTTAINDDVYLVNRHTLRLPERKPGRLRYSVRGTSFSI